MKKLIVVLFTLGLTVVANASLILSEQFTYANGAVTTVSAGVWTRFSGSADPSDATINNNALEVFASRADDVSRALGTTYSSGNLYYSLNLSLATQPTAAGGYIGMLQQGATTFRDRLFVNSSGATGGGYFVGVGNTATAQIMWTTELSLSTFYTVVVRADLDNDVSYLWVNPVDESSVNISTNIASTVTPITFAFRQVNASGPGNATVDNLLVATTFNEVVIPEPGTMALMGLGLLGLGILRRKVG